MSRTCSRNWGPDRSVQKIEALNKKDPFLLGIIKDQNIMLVGKDDGLRKLIEGSPHQSAKAGSGQAFLDSIHRGIDDADSGKVYDTDKLKTELAKRRKRG